MSRGPEVCTRQEQSFFYNCGCKDCQLEAFNTADEFSKKKDIKALAANWGKRINPPDPGSLQDYKEKNEVLERRIKYLEAQNAGLLTSNMELIALNKRIAQDVKRAFSYGR